MFSPKCLLCCSEWVPVSLYPHSLLFFIHFSYSTCRPRRTRKARSNHFVCGQARCSTCRRSFQQTPEMQEPRCLGQLPGNAALPSIHLDLDYFCYAYTHSEVSAWVRPEARPAFAVTRLFALWKGPSPAERSSEVGSFQKTAAGMGFGVPPCPALCHYVRFGSVFLTKCLSWLLPFACLQLKTQRISRGDGLRGLC